jgi:hypothetical protein
MIKKSKADSDRPTPQAQQYDVGYRKPPTGGQFKAGQSGNPKGRPRGARNKTPALYEERLKSIILAEAYRRIRVNEGKRQKLIPMAVAIVRSVAVNAARGDHRSQRLFAEMLSETEHSDKQAYDDYARTMIEYKIDWQIELERRAQTEETGPEPVPHPDDIEIDFKTGRVSINGPFSKEDKARWDKLYGRVEECDRTIEECSAELRRCKNEGMRKVLEDEIRYEQNLRDKIVRGIGEPRRRCGEPRTGSLDEKNHKCSV